MIAAARRFQGRKNADRRGFGRGPGGPPYFIMIGSMTIGIVLNGEARRVPAGLDVAGLLKFLEIDGGRVAVELNREIVRKPDWESAVVAEGAQVEVVWFVGGGKHY